MQRYATPVPKKALSRGRIAAQLPVSAHTRAGSMLNLAPTLHFPAPYPARWSLIHAHPKFDASCCRGNPRIVSWPAYDFGTGRKRCALRHFDGGYPADHRPAGPRRRRLSVLGLYDLRSLGRLGDGRVGPARQTDARLGHRVESHEGDKKKWRFALRKGVKFHDGSEFNADAVIWNLDKVLNDKAPQFDKRQSAQVKTRLPSVASYAKIDDSTVEITTKTVDSFFPYQMLWFLISSPAQYEKLGKDWDKFASQPSGTGPFKLTKLVPRELAELSKNADYWDTKRIPKVDKLVLIPMPEALTRTNALLAGQVDLIETPAPDAVPQLKSAGMRIVDNITPHVWNYRLGVLPGSPWTDVRLRKALNLAIDRDAVVGLM